MRLLKVVLPSLAIAAEIAKLDGQKCACSEQMLAAMFQFKQDHYGKDYDGLTFLTDVVKQLDYSVSKKERGVGIEQFAIRWSNVVNELAYKNKYPSLGNIFSSSKVLTPLLQSSMIGTAERANLLGTAWKADYGQILFGSEPELRSEFDVHYDKVFTDVLEHGADAIWEFLVGDDENKGLLPLFVTTHDAAEKESKDPKNKEVDRLVYDLLTTMSTYMTPDVLKNLDLGIIESTKSAFEYLDLLFEDFWLQERSDIDKKRFEYVVQKTYYNPTYGRKPKFNWRTPVDQLQKPVFKASIYAQLSSFGPFLTPLYLTPGQLFPGQAESINKYLTPYGIDATKSFLDIINQLSQKDLFANFWGPAVGKDENGGWDMEPENRYNIYEAISTFIAKTEIVYPVKSKAMKLLFGLTKGGLSRDEWSSNSTRAVYGQAGAYAETLVTNNDGSRMSMNQLVTIGSGRRRRSADECPCRDEMFEIIKEEIETPEGTTPEKHKEQLLNATIKAARIVGSSAFALTNTWTLMLGALAALKMLM